MNKITLAIGALILLILASFAIFYFYGTGIYDGAVKRDEAAKQAWANVQSDYQRRADLIPNLVATVKGAAENEKDILIQVTNARAGISQAQSPEEMDKQASILNRSIAVIFERYPEIRSTENFGMLQVQLEGTENRIKKSRDDYNAAVKDFNEYVRGFWRRKALSFVASAEDDFKKKEMFEAQEGSENAPKVDFSTSK